MADNIKRVIVNEQDLYDTAQAIREKTGTYEGILLREFPQKIRDIPQSAIPPIEVIDSVQWYKENRDKTYPPIPLPSEMQEEEDMIYILYQKNELEYEDIEINLTLTFSDIVEGSITKFNNTDFVSSEYFYDEDIKSGKLFSRKYTSDDEDWNDYNFVLLRMKMVGVTRIGWGNNIRAVDMSLKLLGYTQDDFTLSNLGNLRYYSTWGFQNTSLTFNNFRYLEVIAEFKMKEGYYITTLYQTFYNTLNLVTIPQMDFSEVTSATSVFYYSGIKYLPPITMLRITGTLFHYMLDLKFIEMKTRNATSSIWAYNTDNEVQNYPKYLKMNIDSFSAIGKNILDQTLSYDVTFDEIKSLLYIGYINRDKDNLDFMKNWNYNYDEITNGSYAFAYCSNLKKIPNLNYEKMNLTNLSNFMSYTYNIEEMPTIDCSKITSLSNFMRKSVSKLRKINLINTNNVTDFSSFAQETLFLNGVEIILNIDSATNVGNMFVECHCPKGKEININLESSTIKKISINFSIGTNQYPNNVPITKSGKMNIYAPNVQPTGTYVGLQFSLAKKVEMDLSQVTGITLYYNTIEEIITPPLEKITTLSNDSFGNSYKLKHLPIISNECVWNSMNLINCYKLEEYYQPNVTISSITTTAFQNDWEIKFIDLTNISKNMSNYPTQAQFDNCYKLETLIMGGWKSSVQYDTPFNNCYSLKSLIILDITSSYLIHSTLFNECYHIKGIQNDEYNPKGKQDGFIFVPSDWVNTLKSATNWSLIASQIRPLEDRYVDRFYSNSLVFLNQIKDSNHITINIREFQDIPNVSFENVDSNLISIENLQVNLETIEFDINVKNLGEGLTNFKINVSGKAIYTNIDIFETREIDLEIQESFDDSIEVVTQDGALYGFELEEDGYYVGYLGNYFDENKNPEALYRVSTIKFKDYQNIKIKVEISETSGNSTYQTSYVSNLNQTFKNDNTVESTYNTRVYSNGSYDIDLGAVSKNDFATIKSRVTGYNSYRVKLRFKVEVDFVQGGN